MNFRRLGCCPSRVLQHISHSTVRLRLRFVFFFFLVSSDVFINNNDTIRVLPYEVRSNWNPSQERQLRGDIRRKKRNKSNTQVSGYFPLVPREPNALSALFPTATVLTEEPHAGRSTVLSLGPFSSSLASVPGFLSPSISSYVVVCPLDDLHER